jgi:putative flippase GtrA
MQFLLYCMFGGIGVLSDYLIFYVFFTIGSEYQVANATGYLAGTLVSFTLNRKITFGVSDQVIRRLFLFLSVATVGYFISALLLWYFVEELMIDARYAKLLTLPVVVVLQFSLNRQITFRQNRN